MLGEFFISVSVILFLGAHGDHDLPTCSTSSGSSCPVTPLVSGPKCPNGFDLVEDYCFKVSNEKLSWNKSKLNCEEINAKLAEPRDIIYNGVAFGNYLLQYMGHLSFDRQSWERFHLGGHYTNNNWEWLTGGKIGDFVGDMESIIGGPCLQISVQQDWTEPISIRGYGTSCIYDDWPKRYVCQASLENNTYSTCEQNGLEYPSGQPVSMNAQQCQQQRCQDGNIQQYGCENITSRCCAYMGHLYGDGDILRAEVRTEDCSGCQQLVCLAGVIQWQDCTNCSIRCCFFNGESYQSGSHIQSACARLVCDGVTGKFNNHGFDYNCQKCKAYLDPHIVTFDQSWSSYNYQGCGNYSLSQIGSSYQPTVAVYATFKPCGGRSTLTCVDTVTFKNDEHTVVTFGYVSRTNKARVRFCASYYDGSYQAYVWAYSDVAGGLRGLCGTANDDVDDDFTMRNGTLISPWQRDSPVEFPLSWLVPVTSSGSCDGRKARLKRQAQNMCETDSSKLDYYYKRCNNVLNGRFPNAEPEERQAFFDDCVYDLCNVNDPNTWIQSLQIAATSENMIKTYTMNFTTTTTNTTTAAAGDHTTTSDDEFNEADTTTSRTTTTSSPFIAAETTSTTMDAPTTITTTTAPATECIPQRKCYIKRGYCISSPETCDGVTTDGCLGQDCVCCLVSPETPKSHLLKMNFSFNIEVP